MGERRMVWVMGMLVMRRRGIFVEWKRYFLVIGFWEGVSIIINGDEWKNGLIYMVM